MSEILVNGERGAGLIASHLADQSISQGRKVVILDDLSAGNIQNIARRCGHKNFIFIKDILLVTKTLIRQ